MVSQAPTLARRRCAVDLKTETRLGSKKSFLSPVYPSESACYEEDLDDPEEGKELDEHGEEVRISYLGVEVAVELHRLDYLFAFDPLRGLWLLPCLALCLDHS